MTAAKESLFLNQTKNGGGGRRPENGGCPHLQGEALKAGRLSKEVLTPVGLESLPPGVSMLPGPGVVWAEVALLDDQAPVTSTLLPLQTAGVYLAQGLDIPGVRQGAG